MSGEAASLQTLLFATAILVASRAVRADQHGTTASPPQSATLVSDMRECCLNQTTQGGNCRTICMETVEVMLRSDDDQHILLTAGRDPKCFMQAKAPWIKCAFRVKMLFAASAPTCNRSNCAAQGGAHTSTLTVEQCTSTTCTQPGRVSYQWCCTMAESAKCRSQCEQFVRTGIQTADFRQCQISAEEEKMAICIKQAQSPSWPSCDGLLFCKNFIRSSVRYSNCSLSADIESLLMYRRWLLSGTVRFPDVTIDVNISQCHTPGLWKALSCLINLQPTNSRFDPRMCRSSCDFIVNECRETDSPVKPSNRICPHANNAFFLSNASDCLSLEMFLDTPSDVAGRTLNESISVTFDRVTNPCSPNPCANQMCVVNHDCLKTASCRSNYTCLPGCPLDQAGSYVLDKQWIKVPITASSPLLSEKYCQCNGTSRFFSRCATMVKSPGSNCSGIADGMLYESDSGQQCLCSNGTETCLPMFDILPSLLGEDGLIIQYSLQPPVDERVSRRCGHCDVQTLAPVCGADGKTYLNKCFAACQDALPISGGMNCQDRKEKACRCNTDEKCVPQPGICLTSAAKCPQYLCEGAQCNNSHNALFCDTCSIQHTQICSLVDCVRVSEHAPVSCNDACRWSYAGRCRETCANRQAVCGMGGQSYHSQCALDALAVPLDYMGECTHIQLGPEHRKMKVNCSGVKCPAIPKFCQPLPPLPGTCCKVCGSLLGILVSLRSSDTYSEATGLPAIRVTEVIQHLQQMRSLSFCTVNGLAIGASLVVVVQARYAQTPVGRFEVQACQTQAAILDSLINTRQPAIAARPPLSVLRRSVLYTSAVSPLAQDADSPQLSSSSSASPSTIAGLSPWRYCFAVAAALMTQLL